MYTEKTDVWRYSPANLNIEFSYREDTNDWNTIQSIVVTDEYLTRFFVFKNSRDTVFVDIGAHIGGWCTLMHALYSNAQIVAVEALKENIELVKKNLLRTTNFSPSILRRAAWNESDTLIQLNYGDKPEGHHRFIANNSGTENDKSNTIDVETISLDDICEPYDHIDLIKIDCEGAEYNILHGASPETLDKIDFIIGEHHYFSPDCCGRKDLFSLVEDQFVDITYTSPLPATDTPMGEFLFKNKNLKKGPFLG